jgi:hypothetical protein
MDFNSIKTECFYGKKVKGIREKPDIYRIPPAKICDSDLSDYTDSESDENNQNVTFGKVLVPETESEDSYSEDETGEVISDTDCPEETEKSSSKDEESPLIPAPTAKGKRKIPATTKTVKKQKTNFNWTKTDLTNKEDSEEFETLTNEDLLIPLEYFLKFFSFEVISNMVYQTNLYSTQQTGHSLDTNREEITDFLSILLTMGIIVLPSIDDYWSAFSRIYQVANLMSVKRFKKLRRHVHFNNNSLLTENTQDRYFKIAPLIKTIRENCIQQNCDNKFSIDETMVAYKGTRAGNLRQYIQNKPHKWGFKIFVRAGVSGMIFDFIPHQRAERFDQLKGSKNELTEMERSLGVGPGVVIALCKTIHHPENSVVYFDNYFSNLQLFIYLKDEMNILSLGTIRSNRIGGCPVETDKVLIKFGRGTYDYKSDTAKGVLVVKWADNKCALLGSTYSGIEPLTSVKSYNKEQKRKMDVPCPSIILSYNKHMGGVDKANALMGLYRSPSKARRWYFPLFTYMLEICVVRLNGWLLYRNDCKANNINKKHMPLKTFRMEVAKSLAQTGKQSRRGRPTAESQKTLEKIRHPVVQRPDDLSRKDTTGHWPIYFSKGRCRYCKTGTSRLGCHKCNARLCITSEKNCFVKFHEAF